LSQLEFNFSLEYAIRKVGTRQFLVCPEDDNILGEKIP
jgi:hypothetical protein